MALMQFLNHTRTIPISNPYGFSRFFSKSSPFIVKVGIPEFLNGVGHGVETHVAKLESEIGDFQKLLVTRTLKLKKIGIPCKHRKLILKYAHKYRLGLWRPRAEPVKLPNVPIIQRSLSVKGHNSQFKPPKIHVNRDARDF
ncbi:hypothetical protein Goshw_012274 [Gossypium schwendimanii]|uniref:Small ribosomal subunit protein mS41 SAM domain-containing protein n=1 Tax=Gossypium schwendimanii TaxID=34291 RepID=A0A7J9L2I5_GOSSC|nr:hypothetical protein [Gossypium schwendimanii]